MYLLYIFSDNCNIWNFRSNFILLVLAYHIIFFCTIFIIYYVTGSMLSAGDIRMNKILVKVAAELHASRSLQDNVVSSLSVIWYLCNRYKDEVIQEENIVESGKTFYMWWSLSCDLKGKKILPSRNKEKCSWRRRSVQDVSRTVQGRALWKVMVWRKQTEKKTKTYFWDCLFHF